MLAILRSAAAGILALTIVAGPGLAEPPAKPAAAGQDAPKPAGKEPPAAVAEAAAPIDPARLAAARKLIELTGTDKQLEGALGKVVGLMQQQFERRAPKYKKEIAEVMAPLGEKYAAEKGAIIDKVIAHYATTLTAEDLDTVTAFFSNGSGQRYLAAVPALVDGTAAIAKAWGKSVGENLRRDVEAALKKRKIPI